MGRAVTIALVGAGNRGHAYSGFAERYPDQVRMVAVADPRTERRDMLAQRLGVGPERRYRDWSELAAQGRESLESHLMAFAAERSRQTGAAQRIWE